LSTRRVWEGNNVLRLSKNLYPFLPRLVFPPTGPVAARLMLLVRTPTTAKRPDGSSKTRQVEKEGRGSFQPYGFLSTRRVWEGNNVLRLSKNHYPFLPRLVFPPTGPVVARLMLLARTSTTAKSPDGSSKTRQVEKEGTGSFQPYRFSSIRRVWEGYSLLYSWLKPA
jgi:hypothetical protein